MKNVRIINDRMKSNLNGFYSDKLYESQSDKKRVNLNNTFKTTY